MFFIGLHNSSSHFLKEKVKLTFQLTQHYRDEALMISLANFLNCGLVSRNKDTFDLKVTKFSDIYNKIIPLFQKYPILGIKSKDFQDFCLVAELMKNNAHLTKEGLEKIRKNQSGY